MGCSGTVSWWDVPDPVRFDTNPVLRVSHEWIARYRSKIMVSSSSHSKGQHEGLRLVGLANITAKLKKDFLINNIKKKSQKP